MATGHGHVAVCLTQDSLFVSPGSHNGGGLACRCSVNSPMRRNTPAPDGRRNPRSASADCHHVHGILCMASKPRLSGMPGSQSEPDCCSARRASNGRITVRVASIHHGATGILSGGLPGVPVNISTTARALSYSTVPEVALAAAVTVSRCTVGAGPMTSSVNSQL